jgi:hypothetical protein
MRHVHTLRFEALESRELLTRPHVAAAHPAPAVAAAPLVLDGTLAVDNGAASTTTNMDGSSTTSIPVAGQLGALGEVRGVWNESVDAFGDYQGPDELRLHDAQGTLLIAFNDRNPGPARPAAHGAVYHEQTQRLYQGTGAYAGASEVGSIELITNPSRKSVVSLTLHTRST